MQWRYAIVIERAETNYSAYAPDVLGCVTTGDTVEETVALMQEALEFHFESLRDYGEPIPAATSYATMVEVALPAEVPA